MKCAIARFHLKFKIILLKRMNPMHERLRHQTHAKDKIHSSPSISHDTAGVSLRYEMIWKRSNYNRDRGNVEYTR